MSFRTFYFTVGTVYQHTVAAIETRYSHTLRDDLFGEFFESLKNTGRDFNQVIFGIETSKANRAAKSGKKRFTGVDEQHFLVSEDHPIFDDQKH